MTDYVDNGSVGKLGGKIVGSIIAGVGTALYTWWSGGANIIASGIAAAALNFGVSAANPPQ